MQETQASELLQPSELQFEYTPDVQTELKYNPTNINLDLENSQFYGVLDVTPQSDSLRSARNNCIIDDFDSFNGSDRISNYEQIVEKIRSVSILT